MDDAMLGGAYKNVPVIIWLDEEEEMWFAAVGDKTVAIALTFQDVQEQLNEVLRRTERWDYVPN